MSIYVELLHGEGLVSRMALDIFFSGMVVYVYAFGGAI